MKKSDKHTVLNKPLKIPFRMKLENYVLAFLFIFTVLIIILLWIFQIKLMPNYYMSVTIRNIKNITNDISSRVKDLDLYSLTDQERKNLSKYFDELAVDNGFMIAITDGTGFPVLDVIDRKGGSVPLSKYAYMAKFSPTLESLLASESGIYYSESLNQQFNMLQLLYGRVIKKDADLKQTQLLYVESYLEPINSTTKIMKEQFVFISLIILELSILLSIFISKQLSRPIVKMAESAISFAGGDYSVRFDESGFKESAQLAKSLNYAVSEVSKVTDLRRELIANVSHDLKTPLTMVKAYAEMIRDLSGDIPEKRNEHLAVIINESDRLASLVNEILELSRLESNVNELNLSEFSILDKLYSVMERYKLMIETDKYDITLITDEDRLIRADSLKFDQIMYNLINNAINYSGDEKKIIIQQTNIGNKIRIDVIDNGFGISSENLVNIFDRYYRGEKVKRERVGTGLGLSIVKEIFKLHGYEFGVISTVGEGSDFWFEIPTSSPVKEITTAE